MIRPRLLACAALLLVATSGCAGSAPPAGYAAQVRQETDDAARALLPAAVADLGVQVAAGLAGYVECDISGWRYRADGELVGAPDPASAVETLRGLMLEADLAVEVRDDGSLIGRRGELSLLVDAPGGPTRVGTTLRHYSFTHDCTRYGEEDVEVARSAPRTDYAELVPPGARYVP